MAAQCSVLNRTSRPPVRLTGHCCVGVEGMDESRKKGGGLQSLSPGRDSGIANAISRQPGCLHKIGPVRQSIMNMVGS